ncbi:peptidoglycan DD-metalloendopeptidase family protein [Butyrivibrio sp. MC2013]|uniref:peptidoglycan DD-metalloendopeptidase family protein n=1 Tax=Butyrivibrio sp. MC2013 TaxID=1280686 RepID=UPI00047D1B19|nr:M23 family metallopeptidase [Butyrivibrio sp. MC2013]
MSRDKQPRKHRRKRHYTFMIISGDSDRNTQKLHLNALATQVLAFSLFAILVAVVCYITFVTVRYRDLKADKAALEQSLDEANAQISTMADDYSALSSEKEELQASADQISKAFIDLSKEKDEYLAAQDTQAMPTGFPLATQSSYELRKDDTSSDSKDNAEEGNYLLFFKLGKESILVSTGDGVVTTITADSKYGKSISIDHGNGYVSIFRCSGSVLVKEGSAVSRGTSLLLTNDECTLGYQITRDGEYVNPEDLIEING